jgi:putative endonuclease
MRNRQQIGVKGEGLALSYLEHFGYQLVEKNCRIGRGEIDLIVIKEGLLVFTEVKTSSEAAGPNRVEDRISWYQQQKIKETAYRYLDNSSWQGGIRFDVILIDLGMPGEVQHYPGHFD